MQNLGNQLVFSVLFGSKWLPELLCGAILSVMELMEVQGVTDIEEDFLYSERGS